ncbi:MAG: EAL domain-containing protein [Rhodoferax sp.]|uniref:EAL domain-containing protein n=1 Tax=Rhodoferax sp. TaxID=50421 RepID=UPI0026030597|nr:EAL domain-containing protein [Rhodoferax sp.]MDD2879488.1 EAL domain-containing protein [Rhodoferax sp.]
MIQGGLGAAARLPIFLDDAQGQAKFWGFANVVLRFPQTLATAQLPALSTRGLNFQLWRIHPDTGKVQVIESSGTAALSDPVRQSFEVPNGLWTLSVAPQKGWGDPLGLGAKVVAGLLVSLLLAYLAWLLLRQRENRTNLETLVAQRTAEIRASKAQLAATLDAIPDLLFEMDLEGRYLACHTPLVDLLAAPAPDLLGKTVSQVLPSAAAAIILDALQLAHRTGLTRGQQIELPLADQIRWFELSIARKPVLTGEAPRLIVISHDITVRKQAEEALLRLSQLYAALGECSLAVVRCTNQTELFSEICRHAVQQGGMRVAWIGMVEEVTQTVPPIASFGPSMEGFYETVPSIDPSIAAGQGLVGTAIRGQQPVWCQDYLNDPRTTPWHTQGVRSGWGATAVLPVYRGGQAVGIFAVSAGQAHAFDDAAQGLLLKIVDSLSFALDNFERETLRQQAERSLREERALFTGGPVCVFSWLHNGGSQVLYASENVRGILGYSAEEMQQPGVSFDGLIHPDDLSQVNAHFDEAVKTRLAQIEQSYRLRLKDGSYHWFYDFTCFAYGPAGELLPTRGYLFDQSRLKQAEERVQKLAYFDALTGLPNRSLLNDRISHALTEAERRHETLIVMFLDLDHFKNINDTLGHRVGDELLVALARRMQFAIREQDTVARLGGDEFILLLPDTDGNGAAHVAEKLLFAISEPVQIAHHELTVTPSIGIAQYPSDGDDMETLSKHADVAMYRAKQGGRNGYQFFTTEMQAHSARSLQIENALRRALERDQFQVHYQPQLSLATGQMIGVEALLRWLHPELGQVSPAEFIPIAETSGQIQKIGEWVLRKAATQAKQWLDQGLGPMMMAVNLSAVQFRHPDLPEMVAQVLAQTLLPPACLELELTESTALHDPLAAIDVMEKLHRQGVRVAIDDFGTGYSSLSYLKRFKTYKLKIDQSFVQDITHDADDLAIVNAVISMARSLGLVTLAEGVETQAQLDLLRLHGCDEAQGYLFSKALPAAEIPEFVRTHISHT